MKTENERRKTEDGKSGSEIFRLPFSITLSLCALILVFSAIVPAQKIAVLAPEKNSASTHFIEKLETSLSEKAKILDDDLSDAAYRAHAFDQPFNLTLGQAKTVGASVGCEFFLLVKAENLKRSSAPDGNFFQSAVVVFAASARTGRLVFFRAESRDAKTEIEAREKLFAATDSLAAEIAERLKIVAVQEANEKPPRDFQSPPEDDLPDAKNFRPPLPYKRMSPIYTRLANLFGVEATVDAEIYVDESGKIAAVEIARWAGFGLDESVAENVRRMTWRAASKNGKAVSTKVLLRYNFKKIEAAK